MFNPDSFTSMISSSGLSRGNRYELTINMPLGLLAAGQATRELSLRVSSVELPGKQVGTREVKIQGPAKKMPYGVIFEDLNFNVMLSENLQERRLFSSWMELSYNQDSSYTGYFDEITANVTFKSFGQSNTELYRLEFEDAYPISIGNVSFSYSNEDIAQLPVTIAYRKYSMESSTGNYSNFINSSIENMAQRAATAREMSLGYGGLDGVLSNAAVNLINHANPTGIEAFKQLENNFNSTQNVINQLGAIKHETNDLISVLGFGRR